MMLRSRKKYFSNNNGSYDTTNESSDEGKEKDESSKTGFLSSISTSYHYNYHDPSHRSIIPIWVVVVVVTIVFILGYASHHYQRTRGEEGHYQLHSRLSGTTRKGNVPEGQESMLEPTVRRTPVGTSLLSSDEDDRLEYDKSGQRYHVIFSTDCSPYQQWQSLLVYYTAMKVRQPGHVTRIVSGCDPNEAASMTEWFDRTVRFMSKRFHIHLTPKFSEVKNEDGEVVGDYKFFNKPYGLRHWLEHSPLLGFHEGTTTTTATFDHVDDIVILIDPDMVLMRPITKDFSDTRETLISAKRREHLLSTEVKHGVPFAQTYGLGTQWKKFDLDIIAGIDSPAKTVSKEDGQLYYPVGPPYIATVQDMYRIAVKWSEFVPRVHAQYPHLLAEMYAFCIAAAHLGLRHMIIDSLMASSPGIGGEAWELVDRIPPDEVCEFAQSPDNGRYAVPSVLHMCQRYSVGLDWFFGKHKIPNDIYDCSTPLFQEPPSNLALLYDYKWPPNAKEKTPLSPKLIKQHTFMVCGLTRALNDAAMFYKAAMCPPGTANLERSRTVADLFVEKKTKEKQV